MVLLGLLSQSIKLEELRKTCCWCASFHACRRAPLTMTTMLGAAPSPAWSLTPRWVVHGCFAALWMCFGGCGRQGKRSWLVQPACKCRLDRPAGSSACFPRHKQQPFSAAGSPSFPTVALPPPAPAALLNRSRPDTSSLPTNSHTPPADRRREPASPDGARLRVPLRGSRCGGPPTHPHVHGRIALPWCRRLGRAAGAGWGRGTWLQEREQGGNTDAQHAFAPLG